MKKGHNLSARYRCLKCGYRKSINIYNNVGVIMPEEDVETLRADILSGKYGAILQKAAMEDENGDLTYVQLRNIQRCWECGCEYVSIGYKLYYSDAQLGESCSVYTEIKRKPICPECGSEQYVNQLDNQCPDCFAGNIIATQMEVTSQKNS